MKAIKTALFALAGLLILSSCNKQPSLVEKEFCTSTVTISDATRATFPGSDNPDESKVNTLEVFIFDGDKVDGHNRAAATTMKVSSTAGDRDIWAFVNAPDMSTLKTKTEVLAAAASLSDNTLSNLVMVGSKSQSISGGGTVVVPVERFVSRVVVKKISNKMATAALQAKTFKIEKIYLTNVQTQNNYAHSAYQADGGQWANKQKFDTALSDALKALIYEAPGKTVAYNASDDDKHIFYTFPNDYDSTVKDGGSWSKRFTKLVIEASLDGTTYYYPINLPKLESNKSYEFSSITITREGSDDPDVPVSVSEVSVSIDIQPWPVVNLGDIEI